jgi:hypothetical protein
LPTNGLVKDQPFTSNSPYQLSQRVRPFLSEIHPRIPIQKGRQFRFQFAIAQDHRNNGTSTPPKLADKSGLFFVLPGPNAVFADKHNR